VYDVAVFLNEISDYLAHLFDAAYITDTSIVQNDKYPTIMNHKVNVINWCNNQFLFELNKMSLLSEVLRQGFETLSEFCQGGDLNLFFIV
jgi:hypothetical protein